MTNHPYSDPAIQAGGTDRQCLGATHETFFVYHSCLHQTTMQTPDPTHTHSYFSGEMQGASLSPIIEENESEEEATGRIPGLKVDASCLTVRRP